MAFHKCDAGLNRFAEMMVQMERHGGDSSHARALASCAR
jgi:hypothetical protein